MKKILIAVLVLILAVLIVSMVASYLSFRKSLPKTKGEAFVPGLKEPVEIYRDEYGVPHIFAQNDHDLYFAAGYAIAQDRLWQLEMIRRAADGRLSEVFGDTTLSTDRFLLTLGFKRIAGELYPRLSETSRRIMRAYTDGINAFIDTHRGKYPMEFMLLRFDPQPWDPEDCVAFSRLMAWELSLAWDTELLAGELANQLGVGKALQLLADYWPREWPSIVETPPELFRQFRAVENQLHALLGGFVLPQGSNNWVVSGKKSETGKPLLANDPHLLLTNPSRWYMIHLIAPGVDVAGFTLPGSPAVVIGFNRAIAWGFTNAMTDDADFYFLQMEPGDSTRYRYNGRWETMQRITERIPVLGQKEQEETIWVTRLGPVVNRIHPLGKKSKRPIALRWIGQDLSDELLGLHLLNRAANWLDFRQAISHFKVPGQNVVYADTAGNIGYWCMGRVPLRTGRDGIFPSSSDRDWTGFVPFQKLPHSFNPEQGFLATSNNRIAGPGYPYYISHLWEPPARIMRIRQLLQAKERFSVEDFKNIQRDVYSPFAAFLTPKLLPVAKNLADRDPRFVEIYQFLKGWDFQMRGESVAAAVFEVTVNHLLQNLLQDELGKELYHEYVKFPGLAFRFLRRLYRERLFGWFDDSRTPDEVETPEDIIARSFQEAYSELSERLGPKVIKWRWDSLHHVVFRHMLGSQPLAGKLFNVGPFPLGGSYTTVSSGAYLLIKPYDCVVGPSMRMIVNLANPEEAEVVNPPGQVGNPLSRHFRDQVEFWLNGLYITLNADTTLIRKRGLDVLRLRPMNP